VSALSLTLPRLVAPLACDWWLRSLRCLYACFIDFADDL
jgi:hypothetical protein